MKFRFLSFATLFAMVLALAINLYVRRDLESNVMDLIPDELTNPEVNLVRDLVSSRQGKLTYAILSTSEDRINSTAGKAFENSILGSGMFTEINQLGDSDSLKAVGVKLFEFRNDWLIPQWLDAHFPDWQSSGIPDSQTIARTIIEDLNQFLEEPDSIAWEETIPADPFLLLPKTAVLARTTFAPINQKALLFSIEQIADPLEKEGQQPVFDALEKALSEARLVDPNVQLSFTNVARFAAASERHIRAEVTRLNLLTSALVILVIILWLRDLRLFLKINLVLAFSVLSAFSLTLLAFPDLHILSLVMGSLLVGVAVDYALHRFLHNPDSKAALWRPLLIGAFTSAGGFIILLFSPLPVMNQMGCFVAAGLISALIASAILPAPAPSKPKRLAPAFFPFKTIPLEITGIIILTAMTGLFAVKWEDNLRELDYPLPELRQNDAAIRSQFGLQENQNPVLALGSTAREARNNLESLLNGLPNAGADIRSAAQFVPLFSKSQLAKDLFRKQNDFLSVFKTELERESYAADEFEPFYTSFSQYLNEDLTPEIYEKQVASFSSSLPAILENLVHTGSPSWMLALVPSSENLTISSTIFPLTEIESLNSSFSLYRKATAKLSVISALLILLALPFLYFGKRGLKTSFTLLISLLATTGLLGLFHDHLTLFHLIGLLLGFCLSLDYVLFAFEAKHSATQLPQSIFISIATTGGVFAILATSKIDAVHALGITVVTILSVSCLLICTKFPSSLSPQAPSEENGPNCL